MRKLKHTRIKHVRMIKQLQTAKGLQITVIFGQISHQFIPPKSNSHIYNEIKKGFRLQGSNFFQMVAFSFFVVPCFLLKLFAFHLSYLSHICDRKVVAVSSEQLKPLKQVSERILQVISDTRFKKTFLSILQRHSSLSKINKILVAIQEYQNNVQVILNYPMVKSLACIQKPLRTDFLV